MTTVDAHTAAVVTHILAQAAASPVTGGTARVVALDGRSGAGKSTLADALATALPPTVPAAPGTLQHPAHVIRLDDLYDGWDGLEAGWENLLRNVLEPMAAGLPAAYHRYDWAAGRYVRWVPVPPTPWLVVEGVGSGAEPVRCHLTSLVWVEAAEATRRRRALTRDAGFAPYWDRWAAAEDRYVQQHHPESAADLRVSTESPARTPPAGPPE